MKTTIRGDRDETIVVDGAVAGDFDVLGYGDFYLGFSDGTLVHGHYGEDDGICRFFVHRLGTCTSMVMPCAEADESDILTLDGDLRWVVVGETNPIRRVKR